MDAASADEDVAMSDQEDGGDDDWTVVGPGEGFEGWKAVGAAEDDDVGAITYEEAAAMEAEAQRKRTGSGLRSLKVCLRIVVRIGLNYRHTRSCTRCQLAKSSLSSARHNPSSSPTCSDYK